MQKMFGANIENFGRLGDWCWGFVDTWLCAGRWKYLYCSFILHSLWSMLCGTLCSFTRVL